MKRKTRSLANSSNNLNLHTLQNYPAADDLAAWHLSEIEIGIKDLDEGKTVDHAKVKEWLESWGKSDPQSKPITRRS